MFEGKDIRFSAEKSLALKKSRGIDFEDVIWCIEQGKALDVIRNKEPRAHQKILIVEFNEYAYAIPYVEVENEVFFKTIYPSRAFTKYYLHTES